MTVTVITVGTLKEKYLKDAVAEYKKRLAQYAKVEEVELKEERIQNEDDRSEIDRALEAEGAKILSAIPDGAYRIALCVEGSMLSSEELADRVRLATDRSGKLALVIGSSHGLSPKVKAACELKLSFSRLTFPHQLIRVNLFEALYRSFTIIGGKKYHK
ncbi:MAG: 23S rRNA (pseudouridine(1915)-N(3))-methyltransferase RlmH [Clostridia bacterium]|nr:23S rRNA (pseudouridine(1915)-N(3))-methyltransferase RlmH [Clostridia bacterium]